MKEILWTLIGTGTAGLVALWLYREAKNAKFNNEEVEITKQESEEMIKNRLKEELWKENYLMEQEISKVREELQMLKDRIEPTHENKAALAELIHTVTHCDARTNWNLAELILDVMNVKRE